MRKTIRTILAVFVTVTWVSALGAAEKTATLPHGIPSGANGNAGGEFLPLGIDEALVGPLYRYHALTKHTPVGNETPLVRSNAEFVRDRWRLTNHSEMVFRFRLQPVVFGRSEKSDPLKFLGCMMTLTLDDFSGGRCIVEFSRNGETWHTIGEATSSGWIQPVVGIDWVPNDRPDTLWFRFRAEKTDSDAEFSIIGVGLEAMVDRDDFIGQGHDVAVTVEAGTPSDRFGGEPLFVTVDGRLAIRVTNKTDQTVTWNPADFVSPILPGTEKITLAPNEAMNVLCPIEVEPNKPHTVIKSDFSPSYKITLDVPEFFIEDYTAEIVGLAGQTDNVSFSWTDGSRKVPKNPRVVEILPPKPIRIDAAKNDIESFQVIVRPNRKLVGLTANVVELVGPDSAAIPAENVQVRYAYYHDVNVPTDGSVAAGFYPDALVPVNAAENLTVETGENLPLWITVRVPNDTPAGTWHGRLKIVDAAGSLNVQMPFELNVWNFALPKKNHIHTAFGFSNDTAFRYHRCKTDEEKQIVLDNYLQLFADCRLSPYNPATVGNASVTWRPETIPPSCEIDFTEFDRQMTSAFEKYPFTDFRLNISGLRHNAPIAGHKPDSEIYETMYADYLRKIERHLAEKGWLDKAFCYWTDEPFESDYPWVADGFALLAKHAPNIRRMLTEEPSEKLAALLESRGTNINIWCPVSYMYNETEARKRMTRGEELWWYVCCRPVAPFCTEFTDHPALELRLWLWQSFQRDVTGVLIWTTNYWTNDTAFPNTPQNPYTDPMCYATGPSDTIGCYGNGDGRFFYPPLSVFDPKKANDAPCLDPPVSSIRAEMLREGIEDYEMLAMLADTLKENSAALSESEQAKLRELLTVPNSITESLTVFTDNPNNVYRRRSEIAHAIERCLQR